MDAAPPAAPPQLSPDGHWRWDGAQWVPAVAPASVWPTQTVVAPYAYSTRDRDGLAIASLVCAIVSLGFGSVAAVILATKSRSRARQERREPSGVALAGLVLGWIGIALFTVAFLAAIAIPVFLNQRHKGEVAHVKTALQTAATMEEAAVVAGGYVPLEQLQAAGLKVTPPTELAVLRYSETSYCLGAHEGTTTLYYSPLTGLSTAPC